MKVILILSVFLILFSNGAFAEVARITSDFAKVITAIQKDRSNIEETVVDGQKAYFIKFNEKTERALSKFGKVENSGGHISLTNHGDYNYGVKNNNDCYKRQCVGFVKSITNMGAITTSKWKQGESISKQFAPPKGTAIAIFKNDGKYSHKHTGIFLDFKGDYMYVLDQNWVATSAEAPGCAAGKILIHGIKYTTGKSTLDIRGAKNYSVIEY